MEYPTVIAIDDTLISTEIANNYFVCDLLKCKGACCVEGDLGAPLETEELAILDTIQAQIAPYLTPDGLAAIAAQGNYIEDWEKDFSTPTIDGKECAYAYYGTNNILKCGIEAAYLDGKISWQKPISCHLYPIRVKQLSQYKAVNYDKWHICSPACDNGKKLGVPVYKFLKVPLIRKFGQDWYDMLDGAIDNMANTTPQL